MQRPNLTVITDTDVLRLTHEGRRITGVRIRNAEGERDIAAREVILSAGALNSPLLLQRTGIGPADHPKGVRVEVRHDAHGLARNRRETGLLRANYNLREGGEKHPSRGWARHSPRPRPVLLQSVPHPP